MRVKQRLKMNLIMSAAAIAVVCLMLALALYRINRADDMARIAGSIILNAFERATLRSDYMQNSNERAKEQWFARQEAIDDLLRSAPKSLRSGDDRKATDELVKSHSAMRRIFTAVVENREKKTTSSESTAKEVEDRLINQLNIKGYEVVLQGRELLESSRRARSSAVSLAGITITFVLIILAAILIINSIILDTGISRRVRSLREGAFIIGGGKLDHVIDIKGDDEFAELADAFNAMTLKLKDSYHALEKEVEERKQAEEALRENEELLSYHVENSPMAVVEWDAEFIVTRWAGEAEKIFGWSASETVGNPIMDLLMIYEEDIPIVQKTMEKLTDSVSRHVVSTNRNYTKDGRVIYCTWYNTVLQGADGKMKSVMSQVLDITERRKAEEDVLQLSMDLAAGNLELEEVNRELESFVYSVSHDLRAPLRTMSAFVSFLSEDYSSKLDEQAGEYMARIRQSSEKMSRLVEDLLDLSRLSRQAVRRTDVDMSALAASVVAGLREVDPGRRVEVSIEEGLIAPADPSLIEIALSNLIGNAWKFTSKTAGARIEFGANPPPESGLLDAGSIRLHLTSGPAGRHPSREGITYYVRDNGTGFDPQYAVQMFRPFHRLHSEEDFEGTGIGLAIVDRIIRRHGGEIWAEGEPGKGVTVYFTLV